MADTVDAMPTKEFFVDMITRDISLEDCVLDLLDNCLDGARRGTAGVPPEQAERRYEGLSAHIEFSDEIFSIEDNCGGIPRDIAEEYAFKFGRPAEHKDALAARFEAKGSIGLYGIGMKRSIFKIGREIRIFSETQGEAFEVDIDVAEWLKDSDWKFPITDSDLKGAAGTRIEVSNLRRGVSEEFSSPSFVTRMRRIIARDYSIFIYKGFSVSVNGRPVNAQRFTFKESGSFAPFFEEYEDETGAKVIIKAGLSGDLQDDTDPESDAAKQENNWGWFVSCNDRVVLAADKSDATVWSRGSFRVWHSQYNGFLGLVSFYSDDPGELPWTTTKRGLDASQGVYRRAQAKMRDATEAFVQYTNERKRDLESAKRLEAAAKPRPAETISKPTRMVLPRIQPGPAMANILYKKPVDDVKRAAEALGRRKLSYRDVGSKTFDYFIENEVED